MAALAPMKAAVVTRPGPPEVLVVTERPLPIPTTGWVRIQVKGFGLNRAEMFTRQGHSPGVEFPKILGIECVGVIDLDPSGALEKGQQVAAIMGGMGRKFDGSYAEFVVVPNACVVPFQSTLSWEILATLPEMFHTTHGALEESLDLNSSDTLLIRGGTSSIGLLAARLAKLKGAKVISTSRSADRAPLLKQNGADDMILETGEIAPELRKRYPKGVSKVLELVGTSTLIDSLQCTAPHGIVSMVGILGGKWAFDYFEPMKHIPHLVKLTIYTTDSITPSPESFQEFIEAIEKGELDSRPAKVFSLQNIADAHRLIEANEAKGKLVGIP